MGCKGNSGFPYSDINAIVGKDQSGVGGGKLGVGHLDGRLESETTGIGELRKMLVVERKTEDKRSLAGVHFRQVEFGCVSGRACQVFQITCSPLSLGEDDSIPALSCALQG